MSRACRLSSTCSVSNPQNSSLHPLVSDKLESWRVCHWQAGCSQESLTAAPNLIQTTTATSTVTGRHLTRVRRSRELITRLAYKQLRRCAHWCLRELQWHNLPCVGF